MTIDELSKDANAALALCKHMSDMGAQHCTIPVESQGKTYLITISRQQRKRKSRVVANPPADVSSGVLGTNKPKET